MKSIRALPRIFVPSLKESIAESGTLHPFEVPKTEFEKLHNVLRLRSGARIGILPDNGTFWECELDGRTAVPIQVHQIDTQPRQQIGIAQALPKGDKIDDVVRSCTEIGASEFILFPSDRSVVQWESKKLEDKLRRIHALAREAAETSFGTQLPQITYCESLKHALVLAKNPMVLSEFETETRKLPREIKVATFFVGPEGGWSPREMEQVQGLTVTLGKRVLRTEHAGFAALSALLTAVE